MILQDDDEIYCHGVDVLNTETQQVVCLMFKTSDLIIFPSLLVVFQLPTVDTFLTIEDILSGCMVFLQLPGCSFHLKGDTACIWRSWTYLSHNHKSTGMFSYVTLTVRTLVDHWFPLQVFFYWFSIFTLETCQ